MNNILKTIRCSAFRAVALYAVLFLLFSTVIDAKKAINVAKLMALNRFIPAFDYLVDFSNQRVEYDKDKLSEYIQYFETVNRFVPHRSDTYDMLGFCYFYRGNAAKSIRSYEKSLKLNPNFFWSNYNLGLIYFQNGQYQKGSELLKRAVQLQPEGTLLAIYSSRIYTSIVNSVKGVDPKSMEGLRDAHRNAYLMIVINYQRQKNYPEMMNAATLAIQSSLDRQGDFYFYAGLAEYEMKRYDRAISHLQNCLSKNANHVEALHYLGLTLQALNNKNAQSILLKSAQLRKIKNSSLTNTSEFSPRIF